MTISLNQIFEFLEDHKYSYEVLNETIASEFEIASLFNPIDKGFYFYNSAIKFNYSIINSIVLVNHKSIADSKNCFIVVDCLDTQIVYYKILNHFYKRKSTGKISDLAEVDSIASIGNNVQIDSFSLIGNCKIGANSIISSNCVIHDNVEIGENTVIESGSILGAQGIAWVWDEEYKYKIIQPQLGGVVIGDNCTLGANTIIVRGSLNENTIIKNNVLFAPGCRLGHGTRVYDNVHFANSVTTGGNVVIGENCFIGSGVTFRPKVKIDENTIIGAGALVVKNTTHKGLTLKGVPAKEFVSKEMPYGMPKPK